MTEFSFSDVRRVTLLMYEVRTHVTALWRWMGYSVVSMKHLVDEGCRMTYGRDSGQTNPNHRVAFRYTTEPFHHCYHLSTLNDMTNS